MKTMKKNLWMMAAMFCLTSVLTSCYMDDDDRIGNYVSGHWFGDMDMRYIVEGYEIPARGSEIQFTPTGWGYSKGYGWEVDYYDNFTIGNRYYNGFTVEHRFDWEVRNQIIYMTFDDPALDCAIVNYRLSTYRFTGWIADSYSLQNMTSFNLRNYDYYWNDYGYGDYIPVKGEKDVDGNDSIATQEGKWIRGVNRNKMKDER